MRPAVLILLLATVSSLAFRSCGIRSAWAVRAIVPGMTIQQAEAVLDPHILAKGFSHGMGSCGQTFYYHLKGDLELEVQMGWLPDCDRIGRISSLEKKRPWDQFFWEPTDADCRLAFRIALKGLETELEVEKPQPLWIRCDDARWRTHRLLDVTVARKSAWKRTVTVDMEDRRIVTAPS